ncbi:MAG: glutathione-disulfide reductase [Betaproteobacteria bacterium]|nr:MAG: glutathione-disulfide reductase [Betaproteobacteria bacterium]
MSFDFDLFTIGGGSGGVRASRVSATYGAKVAIAESNRFGGTCVNVGCIPKKLFSYAAHFREEFEIAAGFGWAVGEPRFDWPTLLANKDREIARLNAVYERVLSLAGVEILRGRATVAGPHAVTIGGKTYSAKHILIATGSWPQVPQIPGREHAITSNEVFSLERLPARAIVVGGGYIAVEFASIFNGLGVDTTLAYRRKRLLRGFDAELGERLGEEMTGKGVKIRYAAEPTAIARQASGALEVTCGDGSRREVDRVLFATGRRPNTANLGLEAAGVKLAEDGAVLVDKYSNSSVDSIHAIGDVTNRINLTPVATAEAMWLARTLFRNEPTPVDHENVPTAVFSDPNLATVGLAEDQARERFGAIDVYKTTFRALKLTLTPKTERTFMKLVVERASQKVVGAHMIGPDAGEIIQGMAIAVKLGATKAQFDATIGIHPTAAEEFVTLREKISV